MESKSIKGSLTEKNLLKAFAGESQAKNRYIFFAKKAKSEGFEQIASIFLETAIQEESHAKNLFKFLEGGEVEITATYPAGKIGSTAENLKSATIGEHEEWEKLYPSFSKTAAEEGFPKIALKFKLLAQVEAEHEKRFSKLLENMNSDSVFKKETSQEWVCRKCGYIHTGKSALQNCPLCDHPMAYFEIKAENY